MGKHQRPGQQRDHYGWYPYSNPDQEEVIDEGSWLQLQNTPTSLGKVAQQAVVNPEVPWNGWSWQQLRNDRLFYSQINVFYC